MNRKWKLAGALMSCAFVIGMVGCGDASKESQPSNASPGDHDHASEGPHHGALIELGDFHAELVHDDAAGSVTIYILDGTGENAMPIDAAEVTINLKHGEQGEQFSLMASPDTGDPAGKSSRFTSTDAELSADLDREGAGAELVVTIEGDQLHGELAHDHHDEEGHHDEDGHEHK